MVGFFLLRTIDIRLFNIVVTLFAVIGTAEIVRALKNHIFKAKADENGKITLCLGDKVLVTLIMATAIALIPVYTFFGIITALAVVISGALLIFIVKLVSKQNLKSELLSSFACILYPNLFLLAMAHVNMLEENSTFALLMIFVGSSLADTFAYLVGSTIGGKKLCPKISPNKTISGAIGGLLGGMIGGVVLYFIYKPVFAFDYAWIVMMVVGLVGALFTEIGDLFESAIKRYVGIKDMGKIFPGHGGVLDRIDGIIFASVVMAIIFTLV